jgi:hypothetical protein
MYYRTRSQYPLIDAEELAGLPEPAEAEDHPDPGG